MEWISVKNKPKDAIIAFVFNERSWMQILKAVYIPEKDLWLLDDPSIAKSIFLDVTHYIEIPLPPLKEDALTDI